MSKTESFSIEVARKRLGDLFTTAMESGYTPWVHEAKLVELDLPGLAATEASRKANPDLVFWGHDAMFDHHFVIELRYDRVEDDEGAGRGTIHVRPADLVRGLADLAKPGTGSPYQLGQFLADNEDGPCADCWLQCVVFGKLVYA